MVHGAQGTLNHLEPPSDSEPSSTAAGDTLDPVDEQQEGEQKAGSGDDELGGNDHDDEAAVVEGTADAKEIPTHSDGFENSNDPVEESTIETDPSNLEADKRSEIVPSEEVDSNTIPHEEEQTENHTEEASQSHIDTPLDGETRPIDSEDISAKSQESQVEEEVVQDQQAVTEAEDQLPAEPTDGEVPENVVPESEEASPAQHVDVPDTPDALSPSGTLDDDDSPSKDAVPITEISKLEHDAQDEPVEALLGTAAGVGDVQQKDNSISEPELENPAESNDDPSLPAVVDTDSPMIPEGLSQAQDEGDAIEPAAPNNVSLDVGPLETGSVQVAADGPAIAASTDPEDIPVTATPAEASEPMPVSDDNVEAEHLQPNDEQEVTTSADLDEQHTPTQEDETPSTVSDSPEQVEDPAQDNETGSVNHDVPGAETVSSTVPATMVDEARTHDEASDPEANAAEVTEVPEQATSALLPDDQETAPAETSPLDPVASDEIDTNSKEITVESENDAAPDPSSAIDEPSRQIEDEADNTKTTPEAAEDVPVIEEQNLEDPVPALDAQLDTVEPDTVDSEEPSTTAGEPELTTSEEPAADHDDSAIDMQPESDASKAETETEQELAGVATEQARSDSGRDESDEQLSEMDFPEGKFDPARDSGVVMNRSDDNLSEVTVKLDSPSEGSDTLETDTGDAQDGGQESSEATLVQGKAPEDVESGENGPAEPDLATSAEAEEVSPGGEDNNDLPQEEVVQQAQEASEQHILASDDTSQDQNLPSDPNMVEEDVDHLPDEAAVTHEQQPAEEPSSAEAEQSVPQEEDGLQEQEPAEVSPPAEEGESLAQEEIALPEPQPTEEPLPAEEDETVPQESISQDQGVAEELPPAEEQDVVKQVPEVAKEPLLVEDSSHVEEDQSLPQEEEASKGPEPPEEPVPAEDLTDLKSDQEDDGHLKDALTTGAAAALVATAAGVAALEISSSEEEETQAAPGSSDHDDPERPRTADKSAGPDETDLSNEPAKEEIAASPESAPESLIAAEIPAVHDPQQDDGDFKPRASRRDSSTQTEELWRPKTPFMRSATPAIVLPDADDSEAKTRSRARVSRSDSRRSIQHAEEIVAAAVIIRAAADTLGETSTRMTDAVKDLKQHENTDDALNVKDGKRGTGDATRSLRDSSANRLTGVDRSSKTDDKPRSPRQHRSSHGSRSSRPSTRESGSKRHSSHRHRHEGDREVEQGSPQTPPRTRDTADTGHRSRKDRAPQEQADHERRKEERRLAREKAKTDSPATESKGKEVETSPSVDRRSSRRHSSTRKENVPSIASTSRTESTAPPQASKKFFDKNGISAVESFGGPLTAETSKDGSLKRSGSKSIRRSLSQSQAKLQKARVEESSKATKEKDSKERPRESRTTSSATSNGKSSTKDRDDKHRKSRLEKREKEEAANGQKEEKKEKKSGGLKGMFKKMFG